MADKLPLFGVVTPVGNEVAETLTLFVGCSSTKFVFPLLVLHSLTCGDMALLTALAICIEFDATVFCVTNGELAANGLVEFIPVFCVARLAFCPCFPLKPIVGSIGV